MRNLLSFDLLLFGAIRHAKKFTIALRWSVSLLMTWATVWQLELTWSIGDAAIEQSLPVECQWNGGNEGLHIC